MDKPVIDTFAERLERLERECNLLKRANRRWRRLGMVAAVGVVAALSLGAEFGKSIEAERFILRANDGTIRAELGLQANGGPDRPKNPRLDLMDGRGQKRIMLQVWPDGSPDLQFKDKDGRPRFSLRMTEEDMTQLDFSDKQGWGQLSVGTFQDGAGVMLFGPNGKGQGGQDHGGLFVAKDGSTKLHFFGPAAGNGGPLHEKVDLGVKSDGSTVLRMRGEDLDGGLSLSVKPMKKPSIKLLDPLGNTLFELPLAGFD